MSVQTHPHHEPRDPANATIPIGSHNPLNPHHLNAQAHRNNYHASDYNLQPATPPRTPQRLPANSTQHYPHVQHMNQDSVAKPRNSTRSNKHRPKNVAPSSSPVIQHTDRNNRTSPPMSSSFAAPTMTPNTAAYAGPTFHASPAPSALPIPSFYSKSVPSSVGIDALLKSRNDDVASPVSTSPRKLKNIIASTGSASANNTPSIALASPIKPDAHRVESPLDFIFNAHRQESARSRTASTSNGGVPEQPALSPLQAYSTPTAARKPENGVTGSARGIFAMELDEGSNPGSPIGPTFSTPYHERINAAKAKLRPSSPSTTTPSSSTERAQAMKDFLFSHKPVSNSPNTLSFPDLPTPSTTSNRVSAAPLRSYNMNQNTNGAAMNNQARINGRSSNLRQEIEITPTKSPADIDYRATFAPQEIPTPSRNAFYSDSNYGLSENRQQFEGNAHTAPSSACVSGPQQQGSSVRDLEDDLRRLLKIELSGGPSCNTYRS